jgi:hypothetical protein
VTLDERDDMAVLRAAEQIAFPMTWNGSVLHIGRTLPDPHGITIFPRRFSSVSALIARRRRRLERR